MKWSKQSEKKFPNNAVIDKWKMKHEIRLGKNFGYLDGAVEAINAFANLNVRRSQRSRG